MNSGPQKYPSLLQLSPCDLMEMREAGTLPSGLYCPLGQNGSKGKPEKRRRWGCCVCVCVLMPARAFEWFAFVFELLIVHSLKGSIHGLGGKR